jgi:hypothetical protein
VSTEDLNFVRDEVDPQFANIAYLLSDTNTLINSFAFTAILLVFYFILCCVELRNFFITDLVLPLTFSRWVRVAYSDAESNSFVQGEAHAYLSDLYIFKGGLGTMENEAFIDVESPSYVHLVDTLPASFGQTDSLKVINYGLES